MADKGSACKAFGWTLLVILLLTLIGVLLGTSIHKLDANQAGVLYVKPSRKLGPVRASTLYTGPPFSGFIVYSAVYQTLEIDVTCVTNDGLFVTLSTNFQYVPQQAELKSISVRFRNARKFEQVVKIAAEAAVHEACSHFVIADFQNGRPLIQTKMGGLIEANLAAVNASSLATQLTNVAVPAEWSAAVQAKQASLQDIQYAINQRDQALYQAQNAVSLAEQQATIVEQTAAANVTVIEVTAAQRAEAVAAVYSSFADVAASYVESLGLSPAGVVALLTDRLLDTHNTDVALPLPAA